MPREVSKLELTPEEEEFVRAFQPLEKYAKEVRGIIRSKQTIEIEVILPDRVF